MGTLVSPCTPAATNDHCISKSAHSDCKKTSLAACSADNPSQAGQIHLALAGPDGMRVSWQTRGDQPKAKHVWVSTDMTNDPGVKFHADRSVQYLSSQGGHGFHHSAKLSGLKANTTYQYRIVNDGVTSSYRTFKTAAQNLKEATFLVIADMGYGENGEAMDSRRQIEKLKGSSDVMLHAGDIAYADDAFLHDACKVEFCYESVYDSYMEWISNVTDKIPYMVSPGNHEVECHSPACVLSSDVKKSLGNFSAYNARFAMPSQESGGVGNMWYSFDYASVHFVVINTETDYHGAEEENHGDAYEPSHHIAGEPAGHFAPDGAYLKWLEADLKAANANRAEHPWVITMGHRPWFIKDGVAVENATRDAHAQLFQDYGVDLFITGHQHSYHRLLPINGNRNTPVICSGGAGCDEFASDQKSDGVFDKKGKNDLWDYRYYNAKTQIGQLKVSETELTWNAIISSTGEIFDTVTIKKDSDSQAMYV